MTQTTTATKTVLCSAITKKGLPCKNHPQHGGTLCGPHGKQASLKLADELFPMAENFEDGTYYPPGVVEATPQPISPFMSPGLSKEDFESEIAMLNKQTNSTPISKSRNPFVKTATSVKELRKDVDDLAERVWNEALVAQTPTHEDPEIVCISGSTDNHFPKLTFEALNRVLENIYPRPYIILGDAKGTDQIVAKYLQDNRYTVEIVKANWETPSGKFRPSAGMERNEEMIRRADRLVAFNHEGFGDGESGFQPVDKGTTQAIEKAQAAKIPVRIFNLSQWEADDLTLKVTELEPAPDIRRDQVVPASEFKHTPSLITLNCPRWIYIGRGKNGTAMQHPGMLALPRNTTHADFKRRIWQRMTKRDPHLLRELARINDNTTLICDCVGDKHTCHAPIVISATNFLMSSNGRKFRMTSREIKDYDAIHNPAYLSTMPQTARARIVSRYVNMIQTPKPKPRNMNGGAKLTTAKPLVKNSRVIFINGDIELPAIVTHIEYGDRWIEDQYTGRRRLEIVNCNLYNEPTKANFIYSDSNAEMIRQGHRNGNAEMPTESGLLPTIAPYIRKVKAVKEIMVTELTANNRIKSGMPIRILDRTTGTVMDVGIAKTIQSAIWYKVVPQAPAIKDAWIVEYLSLLTNKAATWKGDEGTRIEAAY